MGGGAAALRPVMGRAAPVPFADAAAGSGLSGPAGAWLGTDGAPAVPSRSSDNPEGGGPEVETGGGGESRFKASGGPPPAVGGCGANDKSSANPSGGVLLEVLSEPGSQPGRE